ncbi:glycosyltransferase [Streptomyces sp. NBC_00076]|uniref:glycosyltransferase n=1 Tax=Streptomyces sp. NBC_00076 TaxID=2975642 RepID=UPI003245A86D
MPRLAALIPAHNEQDRIAAAIQGLWEQTRSPDLIVVVADNCTDDTAVIAEAYGTQAQVLTGTGTMFRARVLREVRTARRDGVISGGSSYYSLASLTEDDEMTKAVKTLGFRTMSPAGCAVTPEVMPTLGKLWHQRLRWQRGALENLRDYGWTRVTARYFAQQFLMGFGALSFLVYLTFVATYTTLYGWPGFSPFWTAIGLIFMVEKIVSVRRAGPRAILVAALMVPEMLYDLFQHAV